VPAPDRVAIAAIEVEPLSIPLREPFVIATGRIDTTRAVLVRATLEDGEGRRATGLGEAAALPPVTREDQPDLLASISACAAVLRDAAVSGDIGAVVARALPDSRVARAGVEAAILDARARLAGVPLFDLLGARGVEATDLATDITLPIADPERMAANARAHRRSGFTTFKVKVGRDWQADVAALRAVAAAVPDATFRLDANAGFAAREAIALMDTAVADGLAIECFEQPCGADDLAGMAEVAARSPVPVVADESFRGAGDLDRIVGARAAQAVNLKLGKLGGLTAALTLGQRARSLGLRLMAGAMVETRVGLLAMAHVVTALGGVDWVDLDTAFLLTDDPFDGGWTCDGPRIHLTADPGLGVSARAAPARAG
jgi:L-alanine-DL-glutamate epimerase-like enolase superfamily enzyme